MSHGLYMHTVETIKQLLAPDNPVGCSLRTFLSFVMSGGHFEEMKIGRLVLISNLPFSWSLWEKTNFLCNRFTIPKKKMGLTLTVAFVSKIIAINMIDIKMLFQKRIINFVFSFSF